MAQYKIMEVDYIQQDFQSCHAQNHNSQLPQPNQDYNLILLLVGEKYIGIANEDDRTQENLRSYNMVANNNQKY
ncbi:35946_t:CDS:2, partial [Gigaspora margarita]